MYSDKYAAFNGYNGVLSNLNWLLIVVIYMYIK